eukprot:3755409-Alexandrium_andersonii.AAC.1
MGVGGCSSPSGACNVDVTNGRFLLSTPGVLGTSRNRSLLMKILSPQSHAVWGSWQRWSPHRLSP